MNTTEDTKEMRN